MYNNSLFAPHFDMKVSIYRTVSPAALRPRPLVLVVVAGVRPIHPLLHHLGGHLVRLLIVNNGHLSFGQHNRYTSGQHWSTLVNLLH